MQVTILGAGMSGLLAAKAVLDNGHKPRLYAKAVPAVPAGTHYLHDDCGLGLKPFEIQTHYIINGIWTMGKSKSELATLYAQKVGGNPLDNSVSRTPDLIKAYSWGAALAELLPLLALDIVERSVSRYDLKALLEFSDSIISTVPLPMMFTEAMPLCKAVTRYTLPSKPTDLPKRLTHRDNMVVYNLDPEVNWYRFSRINGVEQTELLTHQSGAVPVTKILKDANWQPEDKRIWLAGRCGEWNKNRLVHEVYYNVCGMFSESSTSTS